MLSLKNIKVPVEFNGNLDEIIKKYLKVDLIDYKILKKSLDARSKHEFAYIYEFGVTIKNEDKYLSHNKNKNITKYQKKLTVFLNVAIKY